MSMTGHLPASWRCRTLIALFVAAVALAGISQAVAPSRARAVTAEGTCDGWWDICSGGAEEGGGGFEGWEGGGESPFEGWEVEDEDNDPFEGWETEDEGSDPFEGWEVEAEGNDPFEGWEVEKEDPSQPYRGYLDNGTWYEGPLTKADLEVLGELNNPDKQPYRGQLDDGSWYEGPLTQADLEVLGELHAKKTPPSTQRNASAPAESHRTSPSHRSTGNRKTNAGGRRSSNAGRRRAPAKGPGQTAANATR